MKKNLLALGLLAAIAAPTHAATTAQPDRLDALEARIKQLEANAEAMRQQALAATQALEMARAEIESMKATQEATQQQLAASEANQPAPAADAAGANGNAFNPAISIVLNGSVTQHSLDPGSYVRAGFPLVGEGGPSARGISLGESEISMSANIDDKFYGQVTLAVGSEDGQDEIGIEEAFIDTSALPNGLNLRAGRFFSNIGYLNSHHAHTDKFSDRPLAYQAFLGNQYGDDGVQLRWVAPTDLFLELGAEVFRGSADSGTGTRTLFAHAGGDVGDEHSWLAGISMLSSNVVDGEDGFSGDNTIYLADMTWKWAPQGNFKDGGITVRGEYFLDDRDGDYIDAVDPLLDQPWSGQRRGAYVEGVYRINRNWETGYRYDRLWADDTGPFASNFDAFRHSVMLSWLNSEFSLFRLQYSHDRPNANDTDNGLTLQYQVNLGAHGAHKF